MVSCPSGETTTAKTPEVSATERTCSSPPPGCLPEKNTLHVPLHVTWTMSTSPCSSPPPGCLPEKNTLHVPLHVTWTMFTLHATRTMFTPPCSSPPPGCLPEKNTLHVPPPPRRASLQPGCQSDTVRRSTDRECRTPSHREPLATVLGWPPRRLGAPPSPAPRVTERGGAQASVGPPAFGPRSERGETSAPHRARGSLDPRRVRPRASIFDLARHDVRRSEIRGPRTDG